MHQLAEDLKREEGLRLDVYLDTEGWPTVGYGCRVAVGDKINLETAEALFRYKLAGVVNDFNRIPRGMTLPLNDVRRRVICQMIYQMGLAGTLGFRRMWAAIERVDFEAAAAEMLDSRWAKQTPNRAFRLARVMKEGV